MIVVNNSMSSSPATGAYSNRAVAFDGSVTDRTRRWSSKVIVVVACTPSERAGAYTSTNRSPLVGSVV